VLKQVLSKKLGTFRAASSSRDGKGEDKRPSLSLRMVSQSGRTRLRLDDGCVKAARKLARLVSKGSAACLSVWGASALKKNLIWELDFHYYCFQSGSACCWKVA